MSPVIDAVVGIGAGLALAIGLVWPLLRAELDAQRRRRAEDRQRKRRRRQDRIRRFEEELGVGGRSADCVLTLVDGPLRGRRVPVDRPAYVPRLVLLPVTPDGHHETLPPIDLFLHHDLHPFSVGLQAAPYTIVQDGDDLFGYHLNPHDD